MLKGPPFLKIENGVFVLITISDHMLFEVLKL